MSLTEAHLEPTRMTMLALVQSLWHQCSAEEDVVARALALVESGRVTLTATSATTLFVGQARTRHRSRHCVALVHESQA